MKLDFYLQVGEDDTPRKINPIYKDDLSLDIERENGQMFYRKKLNGKISLLREDYKRVMEADFDTVNYFTIQNEGAEIWKGRFMRTDCTINLSDGILSVQPDPMDEYNDILDAMDNEVDIAGLAIQNAKIAYQRRPMIQILLQGASTLSNFVGGLSFEQETTGTPEETQLRNNYHFALNYLYAEVKVVCGFHGVDGTYYGHYTNKGENNTYTGVFYKSDDNSYYLAFVSGESANLRLYHGSELMYEGNVQFYRGWLTEILMDNVSDSSVATATADNYPIWARYVLDVSMLGDKATYLIPDSDIVESNRNYHRCIGYGIEVVTVSRNFSTTPTKYGQTTDGRYYQEPYSISGEKFYPICQSEWTDNFSFWFKFHMLDFITEKQGRVDILLRNAWEIGDVLRAILSYNNIDILHQKSAICSEILYGNTAPSRLKTNRLFVTPKSNIIVGDYNNPATIAKSSLREILAFMKNTMNIYWHIERKRVAGNVYRNVLVLEHISYYENGGSYTGVSQVGNDLTKIINTRNGKKWSFAQSEITYDKESMPERYQYAWMDETTAEFSGGPIVMRSNYVQKNKIEDVQISNFTSDLDYVLLNPSVITMDGFMALSCKPLNLLTSDSITRTDATLIPLKWFVSEVTGRIVTLRFRSNNTTNLRFIFVNASGIEVGGFAPTSGSITEKEISIKLPQNAVNMYCDFLGHTNTVYIRSLEVSDNYEVTYYNNTIDNVEYILQNGDLAMINLQPKYLTYNMPTGQISVNNMDETAQSVKRAKRGSVTFPVIDIPDPKKLIKTEVGVGEIEKISLNLQSNSVKADLRYDTE